MAGHRGIPDRESSRLVNRPMNKAKRILSCKSTIVAAQCEQRAFQSDCLNSSEVMAVVDCNLALELLAWRVR